VVREIQAAQNQAIFQDRLVRRTQAGQVHDADEDLGDAAIQWISSVDGLAGRGRSVATNQLSPG
jgi:hypothetical protein